LKEDSSDKRGVGEDEEVGRRAPLAEERKLTGGLSFPEECASSLAQDYFDGDENEKRVLEGLRNGALTRVLRVLNSTVQFTVSDDSQGTEAMKRVEEWLVAFAYTSLS
jgi:hypothetical protein